MRWPSSSVPVNAPMNTSPGFAPAGSVGGKSIDDAPSSVTPFALTGAVPTQLDGVLPVVVT